MLPEIDIFGFELQTFGLMLALALTSSGVLAAKRLKELGLPVDWVYEMMFCAGAGGIVGAKLWYVVEKGDLGSLLLRHRARVLRRRDRRRDRGHGLRQLPRLPRLPAVRHGRARARHRLRGRAARLPARRRRRLRHPVRPAVGDGLSRRDRPDHRRGAPDPDLRVPRHERGDVVAVEPPRQGAPRLADRLVGGAGGDRALPRRVHPPQRRHRRAVQPRPVRLRDHDRGGHLVAAARSAARAQSSTTVPSPRSSAPRKARAAAASSSRATPTDL